LFKKYRNITEEIFRNARKEWDDGYYMPDWEFEKDFNTNNESNEF